MPFAKSFHFDKKGILFTVIKLLLVLSVAVLVFTAHDVCEAWRKISAWIDYLKGIK